MAGPTSSAPSSTPVQPSRHRPTLTPLGHHTGKPPIPLHRPVTLVGSRSNARIHLTSSSVSKAHALVVKDGSKIYIRDLASRSKVFINGDEQREANLADGDVLKIGSFTFKYTAGRATAPPSKPAKPAVLNVSGVDYPVAIDQRVMLIGRRSSCDIHLLEESVSTAHAVIFEMDGQHHVRDLGSRSGTFVNGVSVHQHAINPGDVIRIGETTLAYTPGESTLVSSDLNFDDDDLKSESGDSAFTEPTLAANDLHIVDDRVDHHDSAVTSIDDEIDFSPRGTPSISSIPSFSAKATTPKTTEPLPLDEPEIEPAVSRGRQAASDNDLADFLNDLPPIEEVVIQEPVNDTRVEAPSQNEIADAEEASPIDEIVAEPVVLPTEIRAEANALEDDAKLPRRGWRATSAADLAKADPDAAEAAPAVDQLQIDEAPVDEAPVEDASVDKVAATETAEAEVASEPIPTASGRGAKKGSATANKPGRKGGKSQVVSGSRRGKKNKSSTDDSIDDLPAVSAPEIASPEVVEPVAPIDAPVVEAPLNEIIEVPPLVEPVDEATTIEKVAASRTRKAPKSPVAEQPAVESKSKKSKAGKGKNKSAKALPAPEVPEAEVTEEPSAAGMIIASREDEDVVDDREATMAISPPPIDVAMESLSEPDRGEVIDATEPTLESAFDLHLAGESAEEATRLPLDAIGSSGSLEAVDSRNDPMSDTGLSRAMHELTGDVGEIVEETTRVAPSATQSPEPISAKSNAVEPAAESPVTAMPLPSSDFRLGANSENFLGGTPVTLPPLEAPPFGSVGITVDYSASPTVDPVTDVAGRSSDMSDVFEDVSDESEVVDDASASDINDDEDALDVDAHDEPTATHVSPPVNAEANLDSLIDEILEGVDAEPSAPDELSSGVTSDESASPSLETIPSIDHSDDGAATTHALDLSVIDEPVESESAESATESPASSDAAADQLAAWLSKASLYAEDKKQSAPPISPNAPTIDETPKTSVAPPVESREVEPPEIESRAAEETKTKPAPSSHEPTIIPIPPSPAGRNRGRRRGAGSIGETPSTPSNETSSLRDDERIPPYQAPSGGRSGNAAKGFSGLAMPPVRPTDVFAQMSPPATSDDDAAIDSTSADASPEANGLNGHDSAATNAGNGIGKTKSEVVADPFGGSSTGALTPMDLVRDDEPATRNGSHGPKRSPILGRVEAPRDLFFEGASAADADFGPPHRNGANGHASNGHHGVTVGATHGAAPVLQTATQQTTARRPSSVGIDFGNTHDGLDAAQAERRRKLRRVPLLLGLMLLLMLGSAAAIWYAMPPVSTAEAAVTFDKFSSGHTQFEKGEIQKRQIALLSTDSTRHLAKRLLQQSDPEVPAGFIDDADEYTKVATRPDAWSETRQGALLIQHRSNDERGDKARVRAMAEALIAANGDTLTQQAADADRKFSALKDSLAREEQDLAEMDKREQSLRTLGESAPSAADIATLKTQESDLEKKWGDAISAVKMCEAELQQLRNAPAGSGAVSGDAAVAAATPAPAIASTADIDKKQQQLKDVSAQLAAAIAARNEQSAAARKSLDAAFDALAKQIADAKQLGKDSPELTSYIASAQRNMEASRSMSDEMVRRQEQYSAQLNNLKTTLTEKMEQRRVDQMHADPKILELQERIEVAKRQMNAAISAGMKKEADDKAADIKLLESMVKAQQALVPNDDLASETISKLQAMTDAMEKNIADDRKRNDQFFEEQQKEFLATSHVQQMPEAQKSVVADLEKKLADVNQSRQQYNQVAAETGVDDDTTKGLRTQVATLTTAIDGEKKLLADQSQKNLSLEQEKTRTDSIAAKEKQLADLNKAEVDARLAYTNGEKDLRDKQAAAESARASMDQLLDLQRDKEIKTRQHESDKANFDSVRKAADQAVRPVPLNDSAVSWQAAPDVRPLYIMSTCALLLVVFVALTMHTLHTAAQELSLHSLSAGPEQMPIVTEPILDPQDIEKPDEAPEPATV